MKNVIVFSIIALMTACGAKTESEAKLTSLRGETLEFAGDDANQVFEALEQMDVRDTDRLMGATHLRVKDIRCSQLIHAPAGQQAVPFCEFTVKKVNGQSERATKMGVGPVTMMEVLPRNGGYVNGGINANAVAAKSLHCYKPVVPNPAAICVIETL